jgi:hypothetical protein
MLAVNSVIPENHTILHSKYDPYTTCPTSLNLPTALPPPIKKQCELLLTLLRRVFLHTLLYPSPALSSMFFHLGLILEQLLDRMRIRYVATLLDPWTGRHALFPSLQCGEFIDIDARPARTSNPAVVRQVCMIWHESGERLCWEVMCLRV